MNETRIRPAERDDVETLVEFQIAMAWETEQKRLDPQVVGRGVLGVFDQPARGRYLVAEVHDVVVGGLLVTYEWSDWRNGDWWWIQSVYVRPSARGHGLFSRLYREVERLARATPGTVGLRLYVEHDNLRAMRLYEHLGMARSAYHLYATGFTAVD